MPGECEHGFDVDDLMPDGKPRCPLCRRSQTLRDRFPGHPTWDPQSAAAGDLPEEEEP
jgi:hypothetical protein